MMTYQEFKASNAVRALLRSMGHVNPTSTRLPVSNENALRWSDALEMSGSFAGFRQTIVHLNDPDRGFWIDAIERRAGTCSSGEFWLLMGIAMVTDFGHIANALTKTNTKRRTGPWSGMYARLDEEHAAALAACVYHAATA